VVIEQLADRHVRGDFDCGEPSLNGFLQKQASGFRRRGLGVTYVVVPDGDNRVIGFYTLAAGSVEPEQIQGENLPNRLKIPVVLLGQFAVDKRCQGQAIGKMMLYDALRRSMSVSEELGIHGVVLDALNDKAKAFYIKRGFVELVDDSESSMKLYMGMKEIRKLFSSAQMGETA
jgi:GNAT superfamily N-acetyltransferase